MDAGAEACSRARWFATIAASRALRAVALLGLGCGDASLDGKGPGDAEASSSMGGTLPPLDTGEASSSGEASTGEPMVSDDPRWCAAPCSIVLPVTWTYEADPPSPLTAPAAHVVPTMLRDPDGTLQVAELRAGEPWLHRLDREGRLQRGVVLPLPCEPCELTDVAPHPSGDLLLSATGITPDGELSLLAAQYDPATDALVWLTTTPLQPIEGVHVRSGGIAALSEAVVAQLYMRAQVEFDVLQRTRVIAYDAAGQRLDDEDLVAGQVTSERPPLLARTTPEGTLLVSVFGGQTGALYGMTDRIGPPLWQSVPAYPPTKLDDVWLDARGHAIELGHAFDGTTSYLVLGERAGVEPTTRWAATLAVPTTTASIAALALGPDGDVYTAVRTTEAPGGTPEPLVLLALSRWTPDGELRWHTTLLQAVAETWNPLELAVDDDEGLVVAAIVDDRLRVERRAQGCACGS